MSTHAGGRGDLERAAKKVPLYVQIAQLVRQRIYQGEWGAGDTLPAEIALRGHYGVSLETVRSALSMLREEGLIVTEHGAGSRVGYVPGRVTVTAAAGDSAESRMPTPDERKALGLPAGVPVVVLRHPDGREEIYDSMRTRVEFG
jgi:DNA-binding transcriptional MocR family regulator